MIVSPVAQFLGYFATLFVVAKFMIAEEGNGREAIDLAEEWMFEN